jgi:hypothetical protein
MFWNAVNAVALGLSLLAWVSLFQHIRAMGLQPLEYLLMKFAPAVPIPRRQTPLSRLLRAVRWSTLLPLTVLGTEGFGLPAPYLLSGPFMFGNNWLPAYVLAPFGIAVAFFSFCFFVLGPWWSRLK